MAVTISGTDGISGDLPTIKVSNGTQAAPALTGQDTDSGVFFGTNEVKFSTGGTQRAAIDSGGRLLVGTNSLLITNTHAFQALGTTNADYAASFQQDGTDNAGRLLHWEMPNANHANSYFVYAVAASSSRFEVRGNGDVKNTNNSYAAISDSKLKENIVDANSQWEDIKNIRVRNYNFKESTNYETHTQIGVIAQEVETVSPGLVNTSADLDNGGVELETSTKSVNYSVLYMKAIKALQEAQTRIETLETKVAALEAAE